MSDEPESSGDPLNLEAVDRAIRINELNEQLDELGMTRCHVADGCPPEVHEQFLRNMAHFESGPLTTHFGELGKAGVQLPSPESMDDASLHSKLWELIRALAERDVFLYHTDHLSDRELYRHLWTDTLREETTVMPPGSGWRCHLDLIGSGSEADIEIGLRFYDSEQDRQRWARDFPQDVIPPHEDPPHDRDRHLPRADPDVPDADEREEE